MSEEVLASDADNAALMKKIERTIPPMNIADAGRLLDEAKQLRQRNQLHQINLKELYYLQLDLLFSSKGHQ